MINKSDVKGQNLSHEKSVDWKWDPQVNNCFMQTCRGENIAENDRNWYRVGRNLAHGKTGKQLYECVRSISVS